MRKTRIAAPDICCGCSACEQACPRRCITMLEDTEGFLYPHTDETACVDCGLCEKACPVLSPYPGRRPQKSFAAINRQEDVRLKSSSGGIFSLLAENIIAGGGMVYGARYTSTWDVEHHGTDKASELPQYRGSKYVQSRIGHCFIEIRKLLEEGKPVMFVGTPCQVAALHHFLGKSYSQLLTVDFVCHGVPSPAVWKWYIADFVRRNRFISFTCTKDPHKAIRNIEFRNKDKGWLEYRMVIQLSGLLKRRFSWYHRRNPYMKSFLLNLNIRRSCSQCSCKGGSSNSDITLADFWNVNKVTEGFDDDKGTSLILLNTEKGMAAFNDIECMRQEVDFDKAIQFNQAWHTSYTVNKRRAEFFQSYKSGLKSFT